MIFRIMALLALSAICGSAMGSESTTEDVELHDGRHIKVERSVKRPTEFKILDPFFGLPIAPRTDIGGPIFRLKFKHPNTQETITWQGEQYYTPVLLDIVNGVPYLVVNGFTSKKTEAIYGCPELPYFYLKYDSGFFGKWMPVPVEKAPDVLRISNLSQDRRNDAGFLQKVIPKTYKDWNYQYKNEHLNERKFGDCRPPRAPLPQTDLPTAVEGTPEVLETTNYTPDRIATGEEWTGFVFDSKREGGCKKLFRPTDPNDYMQGQRFVKDSSGKKPAPYSRTAQFSMGVRVLCDEDDVWFVTHQEVPGKIVISKFTVAGDLAFRISFRNPDRVEGFVGYIRVPSLRSEGGYLYFDWLDFRDINREWHIKRRLKMRMKEPDQPNPSINPDAAR